MRGPVARDTLEVDRSDVPPASATRARVAVVGLDPHRAGVLRGIVERADDLDLLAILGTERQVHDALRREPPDVFAVDAPSLGASAERILKAIRTTRPRPILVFSDQETHASESSSRGATSTYFPSRYLDSDDPAIHNQIAMRLGLLSARSSRRQKTQTSRSLQEAIDRTLESANREGVKREVAKLTALPLQLLALFGAAGSASLAAQVLAGLTRVSVPVLFAVDDEAPPGPFSEKTVASMTTAPVRALTESTVLRRLSGLLVPDAASGVFLEADSLCLSRWTYESLERPIASMAAGGSTVAAVLLGGEDDGLATALGQAANADVVTLACKPEVGDPSPAVKTALSWGVASPVTATELIWLLENAVPLRT